MALFLKQVEEHKVFETNEYGTARLLRRDGWKWCMDPAHKVLGRDRWCWRRKTDDVSS